jgi:HAD superfamily hydrolase (TIGR01509 family)
VQDRFFVSTPSPIHYSAIIFDLDGVIIDSETLHNAAVAAALTAHGVQLPPSIFEEFLGIPDEVFLEHASRTYLGGRVPAADLLADKQRIFLQNQDQVRDIPGAVDFIHRVRAQVGKLALVTSSLRENQELAFAKFGLRPLFDVVVTAEDVTHTKPHSEPYLTAVVRLGIPPGECVVIEDSLHGIASARGAGCRVVGLATSYSREALAAAGADIVCRTYAEVAACLLGSE